MSPTIIFIYHAGPYMDGYIFLLLVLFVTLDNNSWFSCSCHKPN